MKWGIGPGDRRDDVVCSEAAGGWGGLRAPRKTPLSATREAASIPMTWAPMPKLVMWRTSDKDKAFSSNICKRNLPQFDRRAWFASFSLLTIYFFWLEQSKNTMEKSQDVSDPTSYFFPPFPSIEGKNVIPFKDFKPAGLQITLDEDEEELDGLGIPAVTLRVTHDIGKEKIKKKKKKRRTIAPDGTPVPWYEEWEEKESSNTASQIDP
jgi:hypothetical protein